MRPLRNTAITLVMALLCLLPTACSKKNIAPNPDSVRTTNARAEIENLVKIYEQRNLTGFINLFPFEFRGRQDAADLAERDFAAFPRIAVTVYVDRVTLVKNDVTLYTHWEGFWTDKSGNTSRDIGSLIFTYTGDSKLKLTHLEGDRFFGKSIKRR